MQQSTNSATDTRKGCMEDPRTEGMSNCKQAKSNEAVTQQPVQAQKRQACDDADKSVKNAEGEADRPQASESVHVPNKRVKNDTAAVSVENEAAAQSPGSQAEPAASAAPSAPVCMGFGGLASKGASGFAFGGNSTFGSGGFGSVAFGGTTFGSCAMGANSFNTKASKDKQDDRGSPSVASNAGSVQQQQQQQIGVFTSTADAAGAGPSNMPVFGTTTSAIEGGAREPLQPAAKPLTGEEDESTVWSSKAALYHFEKRVEKNSWRERGIGILRVNVGPSGRARMVMRQLGNLKLLLNAAIFPDLKLERTENMPRVSFCCANQASEVPFDAANEAKPQRGATSEAVTGEGPASTEGSGGMGMYALKMGSIEKVVAFLDQVNRLKERAAGEQGEVDAVADKEDEAAAPDCAEQAEGMADAEAAAAACGADIV